MQVRVVRQGGSAGFPVTAYAQTELFGFGGWRLRERQSGHEQAQSNQGGSHGAMIAGRG